MFDVNAYKRKAEDLTKKQRILTSLYKIDEVPVENEKKKKDKKKVPVDDDFEQISELTLDEKGKNSQLESTTTEKSSKTKRKRKRKLPVSVDTKLNALQSLPDERLKAYGLNPKKLKNKFKYKKT